MSSRNILLTEEERRAAPLIYQTLSEVKELIDHKTVIEIEEHVKTRINSSSCLRLEYFQMVNTNSLESINEILPYIPVTACIAVYAGKIRLIDNIELIS
jgi:pantoate--beta-alanine ligase